MLAANESFTAAEVDAAIGVTPDDLKNLTRPEFKYLPPRKGRPMTVGYVVRAYALRVFRDLGGLDLRAAAVAAKAVAPIIMQCMRESEKNPRLVAVDLSGNVADVPSEAMTRLPVPGVVCHLFDARDAAGLVEERLQDVIDKRTN